VNTGAGWFVLSPVAPLGGAVEEAGAGVLVGTAVPPVDCAGAPWTAATLAWTATSRGITAYVSRRRRKCCLSSSADGVS
jgi:hypothetical protein